MEEISIRTETLTQTRSRVIEVLGQSFSQGVLTLEELEDRTARAEGAQSRETLDALVADLPPVSGPQGPWLGTSVKDSEEIRGHLVNKKIFGPLLLTRRLTVELSLSTLKLDYRNLVLPEGTLEIVLNANMSNCTLYLPRTVVVENRVRDNLSKVKEDQKIQDPQAVKTLIRITGELKLSTLKIKKQGPRRRWFGR